MMEDKLSKEEEKAILEIAQNYPFGVNELIDTYKSLKKKDRSLKRLDAACWMAIADASIPSKFYFANGPFNE